MQCGSPPWRWLPTAGPWRCGFRCRSCASRRPSVTPGASTRNGSSSGGTSRTGSSWCRKNRPGLASRMAGLEGIAGIIAARHARVAAVRHVPRGVRRPGHAGDAVQRRLAPVRRGRSRPQVRPLEQHDARRDLQPRLRAGRGRSRGRQPDAVRDVLRGAAPLLHRGREGVRELRPQRCQLPGRVLPPGADVVLQPPHRPRAPGAGHRDLRGRSRVHDDSRRREAGGPQCRRVDDRRARGRHRAANGPGCRTVSTRQAGRSSRSPTTRSCARSASWERARASASLPPRSCATTATRRSAACWWTARRWAGWTGTRSSTRPGPGCVHGGLAGSWVQGSKESVTRVQAGRAALLPASRRAPREPRPDGHAASRVGPAT